MLKLNCPICGRECECIDIDTDTPETLDKVTIFFLFECQNCCEVWGITANYGLISGVRNYSKTIEIEESISLEDIVENYGYDYNSDEKCSCGTECSCESCQSSQSEESEESCDKTSKESESIKVESPSIEVNKVWEEMMKAFSIPFSPAWENFLRKNLISDLSSALVNSKALKSSEIDDALKEVVTSYIKTGDKQVEDDFWAKPRKKSGHISEHTIC